MRKIRHSRVYLKVRSHYAGVGRNLVPRMCRRLIRGAKGNGRQARMSPAGRNTSVAPDSVAALSSSLGLTGNDGSRE